MPKINRKINTVRRAQAAAAARWAGHTVTDWRSECRVIQIRRSDYARLEAITAAGPAWQRFAELVELVERAAGGTK